MPSYVHFVDLPQDRHRQLAAQPEIAVVCSCRGGTERRAQPRPGAILGWSMRPRSPGFVAFAAVAKAITNWTLRPILTMSFGLGATKDKAVAFANRTITVTHLRRIECRRNFFPRLTW